MADSIARQHRWGLGLFSGCSLPGWQQAFARDGGGWMIGGVLKSDLKGFRKVGAS